MHMTVANGVRASTALAYLAPVKSRSNLEVMTHAVVQDIQLDGRVATGINLEVGGEPMTVTANREVILCAGAVGSPSILQRSGIGPADVLTDAGLSVRHDLPGVGKNMQDHLEVFFQLRCNKPITLNNKLGLIAKGIIGPRAGVVGHLIVTQVEHVDGWRTAHHIQNGKVGADIAHKHAHCGP